MPIDLKHLVCTQPMKLFLFFFFFFLKTKFRRVCGAAGTPKMFISELPDTLPGHTGLRFVKYPYPQDKSPNTISESRHSLHWARGCCLISEYCFHTGRQPKTLFSWNPGTWFPLFLVMTWWKYLQMFTCSFPKKAKYGTHSAEESQINYLLYMLAGCFHPNQCCYASRGD